MEDVEGPRSEPSGRVSDDSIRVETLAASSLDLDGDGKVSPWESNLCRICLIAAITLAFGDNAVQLLL